MHSTYRCPANHIVAVHRGVESNTRKKIGFKLRPKLLQLGKRKAIEFATPFQTIAHREANFLVRLAKGNTLVHEVSCRRHGVEEASLAGTAHASRVEAERRGKPGQQRGHPRRTVGCGKERLLALLQVLVIG